MPGLNRGQLTYSAILLIITMFLSPSVHPFDRPNLQHAVDGQFPRIMCPAEHFCAALLWGDHLDYADKPIPCGEMKMELQLYTEATTKLSNSMMIDPSKYTLYYLRVESPLPTGGVFTAPLDVFEGFARTDRHAPT
ncbi:hypothetical protein C2E23DRAFT_198807 [Lenzites betulinus]|nr:hypothetical protein C2E23DRAFT_198807 [Lenzites betulinus]